MANARSRPQQHEPAARLLEPALRSNQLANAGRIDRRHAGHIQPEDDHTEAEHSLDLPPQTGKATVDLEPSANLKLTVDPTTSSG